MMTESVYLFRFILYCAYSPSINNVEAMKELDKLILIWAPSSQKNTSK